MQFSDVVFNVDGREFPAHKSILSVRCEVLAAMFQDPTKENSTHQVKIEDIEPEVFQVLLHFLYTGRLNSLTMETMAAKLFIVAEKYVLDELKLQCENYLSLQMSPVNCAELILHDDLLNPAEYMKKVLKEAAQCFRYLPGEVMATDKWEKTEKENPQLSSKVQNILFSKKGSMFWMTSLKEKNVQSNICFPFSNWIKNKNMLELKIYASLFHIQFSLENQISLAS